MLTCEVIKYRKSPIIPPGEGGGGEGVLNREGGLFNLAKTMVSVLHKEQEYKVEKLNRSRSRRSKTNLSFQLVNKARLIRGRGLNRGFTVTRIEQLVPKYSLTGGFLRRLETNMKYCETSLYIPN